MSPPVLDTAVRLRRLLAILTWLTQVGEAPIVEVAERFDLTPDTLVAELEMAACCGLPPYTPDQLMEIVVTEDTVAARLGPELARPRRLSAAEGMALAASARAVLAVPGSDGDGALARALAKLDQALGSDSIRVELDAPKWLPAVRRAVEAGSTLSITYYSASSDRTSGRDISPVRLFASAGHWYVDAHCSLAGDLRRFRVDRIERVEETVVDGEGAGGTASGPGAPDGGPAPPAATAGGIDVFVPGPDTRTVRLALAPELAWMLDSIPAVGTPGQVGNRIEVDVAVGGDAWLERLVLQLGPGGEVVHPASARRLGAEAAARILVRYRRHGI